MNHSLPSDDSRHTLNLGKYSDSARMWCLISLLLFHLLSNMNGQVYLQIKKGFQKHFNDITNLVAHPYCWCVHTAADRCQSCILTARGAATAKCTQLACVTFNYGPSTFHETVIEPGALTLFKTTGALPFTLCESSISADSHQQKPPCGTWWGYHRDGAS